MGPDFILSSVSSRSSEPAVVRSFGSVFALKTMLDPGDGTMAVLNLSDARTPSVPPTPLQYVYRATSLLPDLSTSARPGPVIRPNHVDPAEPGRWEAVGLSAGLDVRYFGAIPATADTPHVEQQIIGARNRQAIQAAYANLTYFGGKLLIPSVSGNRSVIGNVYDSVCYYLDDTIVFDWVPPNLLHDQCSLQCDGVLVPAMNVSWAGKPVVAVMGGLGGSNTIKIQAAESPGQVGPAYTPPYCGVVWMRSATGRDQQGKRVTGSIIGAYAGANVVSMNCELVSYEFDELINHHHRPNMVVCNRKPPGLTSVPERLDSNTKISIRNGSMVIFTSWEAPTGDCPNVLVAGWAQDVDIEAVYTYTTRGKAIAFVGLPTSPSNVLSVPVDSRVFRNITVRGASRSEFDLGQSAGVKAANGFLSFEDVNVDTLQVEGHEYTNFGWSGDTAVIYFSGANSAASNVTLEPIAFNQSGPLPFHTLVRDKYELSTSVTINAGRMRVAARDAETIILNATINSSHTSGPLDRGPGTWTWRNHGDSALSPAGSGLSGRTSIINRHSLGEMGFPNETVYDVPNQYVRYQLTETSAGVYWITTPGRTLRQMSDAPPGTIVDFFVDCAGGLTILPGGPAAPAGFSQFRSDTPTFLDAVTVPRYGWVRFYKDASGPWYIMFRTGGGGGGVGATGNLVAGTNVTFTGSGLGRLVGAGNLTIDAAGGGGGPVDELDVTDTDFVGSTKYYGGVMTISGDWKINRWIGSVKTEATEANNPSHTTLVTAWANRTTLTYS